MSERPPAEAEDIHDPSLKGTTYRVYRYMLKQRRPLGISQVQNALGFSSSSVSEYHLKKLLRMGLVREEQGGYVVDKVVIENVVRIRRVSVPIQTAYLIFFSSTLGFLLVFLRPDTITSLYFFAVAVNLSAVVISLYEVIKTLKRL